jgi:hypothetical protein
MSKDLVKEANDFCEEFNRLYQAETDPVEKIILLQILTERMNAWSVEQQLRIIQRKSKETA